jgi:hypothetical protein
MRTFALIFAGLLPAFFAPAAETPRPSPELTMKRTQGPPFQLSQFRGKIIALAFTQTTCEHCQLLTRALKVIQTDYAARNVQVVECAFDTDVQGAIPLFMKVIQPNFPVGYTDHLAVKKYLKWSDERDGMLYVPYMIFIDAGYVIQGDYSGKDGFFKDYDKRVRGVLDTMVKSPARPAARKK